MNKRQLFRTDQHPVYKMMGIVDLMKKFQVFSLTQSFVRVLQGA